MNSLGLTWSHFDSLDLTWIHFICHLSFALRLEVDGIVGMALRADASHKGQRGPAKERKATWNVAAACPHLEAASVAGVGPPS